MSTGMTWSQVRDELDFPAVAAYKEYWREYPPVHVLARAYTEYKPPPKPLPVEDQAQSLMALIDGGF